MSQRRFSSLSIALLMFGIICAFNVFCVPQALGNQSDAAAALSSAQNTISSCYSSARIAESKGANITALTDTLNQAGLLLSQAELAYSSGNFDAAANYAVQSQNKLANFVAQADDLAQTAAQKRNSDFLFNVLGSSVGAVTVVVVGVTLWVLLERRYETGDVDARETASV
jgi:VanZ family protein